jgi:hypothetical protein
MRVYIIGKDGITLCREPPAGLSEGEIVVASNEELHAAHLSSKRLLALWNALPGVERQKKVGDREALIDQLWSAIEALPAPQPDAKDQSRQDAVIGMLRRPKGTTVDEMASASPKTAARRNRRRASQSAVENRLAATAEIGDQVRDNASIGRPARENGREQEKPDDAVGIAEQTPDRPKVTPPRRKRHWKSRCKCTAISIMCW